MMLLARVQLLFSLPESGIGPTAIRAYGKMMQARINLSLFALRAPTAPPGVASRVGLTIVDYVPGPGPGTLVDASLNR